MTAAPMPTPVNAFRRLWDLGYRRLVPIVPPQAELSPHSSLAKRPACRGKAVGELGQHGWKGLNWHTHETTEDDLDRWFAMGAGVGTRTGAGLMAIDIDTIDPAQAAAALALALEIFGPAPRRIGRAPKVLLPYRTDPDTETQYQRVDFITPFCKLDERGNPIAERVEILGRGRQYVTGGIHPTTMRPYSWPDGVPAYDALTLVSPEQIQAYFDRLLEIMPQAARQKARVGSVDYSLIDQRTLQDTVANLAPALAAIPNDRADREGWIDLGIALKSALPQDPEAAFDLWWEHSLKWKATKDYEAVLSEWNRMPEGPYGIGAPLIYALASKATGRNMAPAETYFDVVEAGDVDTSGFPEGSAPAPVEIVWINPQAWHGRERVKRRWFVDGLIPDGVVTLLTGKGGIGKSLLAQQIATSIALGVPALGREVARAKVMVFACEDDEDELHGRQMDICAALACDVSDLSSNLRIASRVYMDNLLATFDRGSASMRVTAVFLRLEADALAFGAKLVFLDTIADTFGGDEINRQQVRQYIQACAGRLAKAIGGAVVLLGHPSKSGEQSGDGTSGSTAWHATVRSRLYLEEAGKPGSGFRKLTTKKSNYGPTGDDWTLQWKRGVLEVVTSSSPSKGVPETASTLHGVVMSAVRGANAAGVRIGLGKTSKFRAEPILRRRDPSTFAPYSAQEVDEAIQTLFALGQLVEERHGHDEKRNPIVTLMVVEKQEDGQELGNVFD